MALVLGWALELQVNCGSDEQPLDPRFAVDDVFGRPCFADSSAPGIRDPCKSDWDCAWGSEGPLTPAEIAAPGASDDCTVHSGMYSRGNEVPHVQPPFNFPNPCNPCSPRALREAALAGRSRTGNRCVASPLSSQAAMLAGRCVRFADDARESSEAVCSFLWLQASRAMRRRPCQLVLPSACDHLSASAPKLWPDESFPASDKARNIPCGSLALHAPGLRDVWSVPVCVPTNTRKGASISPFPGSLIDPADTVPGRAYATGLGAHFRSQPTLLSSVKEDVSCPPSPMPSGLAGDCDTEARPGGVQEDESFPPAHLANSAFFSVREDVSCPPSLVPLGLSDEGDAEACPGSLQEDESFPPAGAHGASLYRGAPTAPGPAETFRDPGEVLLQGPAWH